MSNGYVEQKFAVFFLLSFLHGESEAVFPVREMLPSVQGLGVKLLRSCGSSVLYTHAVPTMSRWKQKGCVRGEVSSYSP